MLKNETLTFNIFNALTNVPRPVKRESRGKLPRVLRRLGASPVEYRKLETRFYARKLCFQRVLAIAILFVRLSVHGWIRQKRSKLGSPNLNHRLPGRL